MGSDEGITGPPRSGRSDRGPDTPAQSSECVSAREGAEPGGRTTSAREGGEPGVRTTSAREGRDRPVDAARVGALMAVVVGHWLVTAIRWEADGTFAQSSPLAHLPGTWVGSWLLQVIPLFFLVGGFANATSLARHRQRGRPVGAWLARRWRRLLGPAVGFVAVWVVAGVTLTGVAGVPARAVVPAGMLAVQPLWFLVVYVVVASGTPWLLALHRRAGWWAVLGLWAGAGLVDVAVFAAGAPASVGFLNVALVWVAAHQLGFVWADGGLPADRGWQLAGVALAGMVGLVVLAGYPPELVGVTGRARSNMNPPSLMMVGHTALHAGIFAAVHPWLARWLADDRRFRPFTLVGRVVLTVFVWHQTVLIGLAALAAVAGGAPGLTGAPTSWGWVAWRLGWFPVLGVALAGLVAAQRRLGVAA